MPPRTCSGGLTRCGLLLAASLSAVACGEDLKEGTGVGQVCVPDAEYDPTFTGFSRTDVSVVRGAPDCSTRLCLVNHFQGRVSCPYGQTAGDSSLEGCSVPDTGEPIVVPVPPQLVKRRPKQAVHCSCRCANAAGATDDGASYCACPVGFDCVHLIDDLGIGAADIPGSYCIRPDTAYDQSDIVGAYCDRTTSSCESEQPY